MAIAVCLNRVLNLTLERKMLYQICFLAFVSFIVYRFYVVIYRLFFHPLAKIPGPKLAAATTLYESYYDFFKGGTFTFRVRNLHKEYGMHL